MRINLIYYEFYRFEKLGHHRKIQQLRTGLERKTVKIQFVKLSWLGNCITKTYSFDLRYENSIYTFLNSFLKNFSETLVTNSARYS